MAQRRKAAQSPGAALKAGGRSAGWAWLVLAALVPWGTVLAQAQDQALACPGMLGPDARQVTTGGVTLAWRALPHPIPLNKAFELDVLVCGSDAQLSRVDADMPAHRHGMNYRTSLSTEADGRRSRARGLVFHMPGKWRLIFDVQQAGQRLRLTDTIDLP